MSGGARAWDALYARGPAYHGPAPRPSFAARLREDAVVLDLGCGAGKSTAGLRAAGRRWRIVGLDASRAGLRWLQGPSVRADAARLPLREGCADAAVLWHLLEHLEPAGRASVASEVRRVVRPGGWVEVRAFAAGDLRDGTGEDLGGRTFRRGGIATHYFEDGEVGALFRGWEGTEATEERATRFATRPRRVVVFHAQRT